MQAEKQRKPVRRALGPLASICLLGIFAFTSDSRAEILIEERFDCYPDNALISTNPAGPALGLTGEWMLDSESNFYVNRTELDLTAGSGTAVYDMPFDDNGTRTAWRSTSRKHVLFSNDGDAFYASIRLIPPRASGGMTFTLGLERFDGGGQADLSFGMRNGAFIVGNGGGDINVSGGIPIATEMRIVLRVEIGDASGGPDDDEVITLWVNPADEFSSPVIDNAALDLLNRGGGRITGASIRGEQMAGQPAFFDDLLVGTAFEDVTETRPTSGLTDDVDATGLFFDPENPGHGLDLNVHETGLTVMYYGHTLDGDRLWLISGTFQQNLEFNAPIDLQMYEVIDGVFGDPIHVETFWGTISITMTDCNTGHASFDGVDGQIEMDFIRLTRLPGTDCR